VQDLCQLELLLLVRAVRDNGALFLAGDTAQTVAAGVAFRFEDVKKLLTDVEELKEAKDRKSVACGATACLSVNYRSHEGIVAAAASAARLLMQLFPAVVDRTPPERGCFAGARPLLVTHTRAADILRLVLDDDADDDDDDDVAARETVDFGAHQAFLVRDDAGRAALLADAPELRLLKAQVLTVAESKGLEFTDVICWNLASDSPFEAEWRVVAAEALARWQAGGDALQPAEAAAAAARAAALRPLPLDERAHGALEGELKLLYVALTRARRRLLIVEQHAERRRPLYAFLAGPSDDAAAHQTPVAVLADRPAARRGAGGLRRRGAGGLTQASAAGEWRAQGATYAARGLYAQAADAYGHAGDAPARWRALALHAAAQADGAAEEPGRERALRRLAARRFLRAEDANADAAACLRAAGEDALADALEAGAC
jgi:hypothetical protein